MLAHGKVKLIWTTSNQSEVYAHVSLSMPREKSRQMSVKFRKVVCAHKCITHTMHLSWISYGLRVIMVDINVQMGISVYKNGPCTATPSKLG